MGKPTIVNSSNPEVSQALDEKLPNEIMMQSEKRDASSIVLDLDNSAKQTKLPFLWVSDFLAGDQLRDRFSAIYSPEVPALEPKGHQILGFDPDTPERIWRERAYTLLNAGCQVSVAEVGGISKECLEWRIGNTSADAVALDILCNHISFSDWEDSLADNPLSLREALELAELVMVKLGEGKEATIALDALRRRANVSSFDWNKEYLPAIRAQLEKTLALSSGNTKHLLSASSLRDHILEILNQNQNRSPRDEAFVNLAQVKGIPVKEIKELAASLEAEIDIEESRSDRKAEIENLLKIGKYELNLNDYLDPSVAQPLERVAGWMGTTPAAMLITLYPVIASLLKVGTRLELIKATDFYALPVIYTGLVCESGAGKTPAQKTVLKPLFELQAEAEIEYKERLNEYQQELAEWKKIKDNNEPAPEQPVPREYYITDATSEAIALIQSQQPDDGFLGWFDELPALFKSQGQYKNGRGADGEKILSGRDGTGFKVNRASGKRLVVNQSAYSITGSVQPSILRKMMGDFSDANGQWARFLWTVIQVQPALYPDDAIPFDTSGLLKGIYRRISKLDPQTYKLSPNAQKLYRDWYNQLDQLKMSESRQGLRAVYSKMKGDTGVLALLLHCFNGCVAKGSTPDIEVSEQTMAAAIKLAKYYIGQVKLIHSEGDAANGELAAIHTKIIQLSERKGWLNAAYVRKGDREIRKQFSANDIRRHFQELEEMGFGQTRGDGTRLKWSVHKDDDLPPDDKTRDKLATIGDNSRQESKPLESTGIPCVQPFTENNLEQTRYNSLQTRGSLEMPETIANTEIQPLEEQIRDIRDTFALQEQTQIVSPSENQINEVVADFNVASCRHLENETHNSIAVSVSTQDKTSDKCSEGVANCRELEANSQEAATTPLEQLIIRLANVTTKEGFETVTAGQSLETIQDAIDLQNTAAHRQLLKGFFNEVHPS